MKRNIAIVAGGDSAEYEISLKTAKHIQNTLDPNRYNPILVMIQGLDWHVKTEEGDFPIDRNDFSFSRNGEKVKFDFAYIAIHGTPGENGILQGYFQLLQIPHSTCNVLSSSLSFNKHACNSYLRSFGFTFANSILLKKGESMEAKEIVNKLGLPCFVKPNADGSSVGISKVKTIEELQPAIAKAFLEGSEVIIEEFLEGTEVTCGLVKTSKEEIIFPITEVIPKKEFFDFEAKYDPNMAEEITPARISPELTERIQTLASQIYDALKCKGIVRIDFIIRKDEIYMLEANTVPGMTATSFIPQQVRAMNRELRDILTLVIEDAL